MYMPWLLLITTRFAGSRSVLPRTFQPSFESWMSPVMVFDVESVIVQLMPTRRMNLAPVSVGPPLGSVESPPPSMHDDVPMMLMPANVRYSACAVFCEPLPNISGGRSVALNVTTSPG